jgi:hypothetical protein
LRQRDTVPSAAFPAQCAVFSAGPSSGLVKIDPTTSVSDPSFPTTAIWTEDDAAAYEKHWLIGTKQWV